MNFSDAMGRAVNIYKSRCYFDPDNEKNDIFVCPKCKEIISYNDTIEVHHLDDKIIYYKCPLCGELF